MDQNEIQDKKVATLRTLRTIRFFQICGAAVTGAATLAIIITDAVVWLRSPETRWSGVAYCFLAVEVSIVYLWSVIYLFDNAGWELRLPKWSEMILVFILVEFFPYFQLLFMLMLLFAFSFHEHQSPPLIYSVFAAGTFIVSLFFFGCANETSLDIRKKLDPNFKVCRGFT